MTARLLSRIEDGSARCGVIGMGYVGLPLALEIARSGFTVLGYDVSEQVIEQLNSGISHIRDVTSESLRQHVDAGRLEATRDPRRLGECDVLIICVPTPLGKTRDPDVSYVVAAAEAVAATLRPDQLIILESTTYPGTTRDLMLPVLAAGGLEVGSDFYLCFSPERVDPGNERWLIRNTPKVIGGITHECLQHGMALYRRVMQTVVPVSSTDTAELTKLLENTFRAVNIALVNEMAQVCDRLDVDVFEVIEAASTKPFGFMKFVPGPGIGGHCIPLDPHYLAWKMKTLSYRTRMIELAGEVNSEMPRFVTAKVSDALNDVGRPLRGSRILVLGVAYKRDIDDVRESPALDIIRLLEEKGAVVVFHDPHVRSVKEDDIVREGVELTQAELSAAHCIVITTDHSSIDYSRLIGLVAPVVDTRNAMRGLQSENVIGLSGVARGGPFEWSGAS
ncbi:MAG TPA: nucleotide sugar dehydrogenase [Longimicrobiales bacterium]|nr:nucleotide sugar dehydrogenase [Longimicrobiales bacterium]